MMKNIINSSILLLLSATAPLQAAQPMPDDALIYTLKNSMVKVSSSTKTGGHGWGTGVAITKDHVLTNCHVLQDSDGISVSHWGTSYPPVGLQADWEHDLCVLRFEWVGFAPVELGDSETLQYEQPIISISMPGDSPAPDVSFNKIKALYPLDGAKVIRSSSAFAIGASGSPVFDYSGKLIATSTFKSPGQAAYYYNMPVAWVKKLMLTPEIKLSAPHGQPFWDTPEKQRPYFMRVVIPMQNGDWNDLLLIANEWAAAEPNNAEAWYYSGLAHSRLGHTAPAIANLMPAVVMNPLHINAHIELAVVADKANNAAEFQRAKSGLLAIDASLEADLNAALQIARKPVAAKD